MTKKEKLTELLELHLGEQFKYFPKHLLNDEYLISVGSYNKFREKIKCTYSRPMSVMIKEPKDVGNEQRGQDTDQILSPKNPKKSKWDGVVYSAVTGFVELGPLLSVIRGYSKNFYSDFLHRRILFEKVVNDEWIISFEPTKRLKPYFEDKDSIIDKKFSEWPKKHQKSFLSCEVESVLNIYTSTDLKKNLEEKSYDFLYRNDNVTKFQKIHSIESELNTQIKTMFGLRLAKYEVDDEGQVSISEELTYKDIRKNCPLGLLRDKNLANVTGKSKGYDNDYNRITKSGYINFAMPTSFIKLQPYKLGVEMMYVLDKVNWAERKHLVSKYVDLDWNENSNLEKWISTRKKFTTKELNNFKNKCETFYKFYYKLQDLERVSILTPSKLFQTSISDILPMWFIFLELEQLGKFHEYDNQYTSENPFLDFGLEYEIVSLLKEFKKIYKQMPADDVDNFYSHRRNISKASNQSKVMKSFFKNFIKREFKFEQDGKTLAEWKMDTSKYYEWNSFRFRDSEVSFSKQFQSESYDNQSKSDWVTGQPMNHNHMHGHHIIYRDWGGVTKDPNCAMVLDNYNISLFKKYSFSSEAIRQLLDESPELFTDEKIQHWNNGGLESLEEYETNFENYYWPTYVR